MATTTIDVNSVRENIENMTKFIEEQDAAMGDIEKQVRFLANVWNDAAQKEFEASFAQTKKEVTEFNGAVREYINMMRESVDKFAALDEGLYKALR